MYEETCEHSTQQNWVKLNSPQYKFARRPWRTIENIFICKRCQATVFTQPMISGVQNRNHCPYCLWSRHVDHSRPGDRMSACKAIMQPIGLTLKRGQNKYGQVRLGELMLIHQCNECGKLSINRIAADDLTDRLLEIFYASPGLDRRIRDQLSENGIQLLREDERYLVLRQLQGISHN
jgi:DNA-directed RNA polymerase subunit RPC12/RpoP